MPGMQTWLRHKTGETYMVHLCGRPLHNRGRCTLGRETAIQKMVWRDDWLWTADGRGIACSEVEARNCRRIICETLAREDFDEPHLPLEFQWLRSPGRKNSSA